MSVEFKLKAKFNRNIWCIEIKLSQLYPEHQGQGLTETYDVLKSGHIDGFIKAEQV